MHAIKLIYRWKAIEQCANQIRRKVLCKQFNYLFMLFVIPLFFFFSNIFNISNSLQVLKTKKFIRNKKIIIEYLLKDLSSVSCKCIGDQTIHDWYSNRWPLPIKRNNNETFYVAFECATPVTRSIIIRVFLCTSS